MFNFIDKNNRFIVVSLFLTLLLLIVISTIKINRIEYNTNYAKVENDSLKKIIKIHNIEYNSALSKLDDSISILTDRYKKDSVFYINLYEMNWDNICFFEDYFKLKHPEIVKAQILLETNYLQSEACKVNRNLFGMRYVNGRLSTHSYKYFAFYSTYVESIMEYKMWQDFYYKNDKEDYFAFLKRMGYAPKDKLYNYKLKEIIKTEKVKQKNNFSKNFGN